MWRILVCLPLAGACASVSTAGEGQHGKLAAGEWCGEHGKPEMECYECHPELAKPPPEPPEGADLVFLSSRGEDVASLEAHVAPGKVTLFDFYADWCGPCRTIDAHVFRKLETRRDLALRKLNIVSWDSPLAKHHLADVGKLPYVVVYDRHGKFLRAVMGLDLASLDAAIDEGAR